ncbi:hypothetical protein AAIC24_001787, partial [Providencia rettgeri]
MNRRQLISKITTGFIASIFGTKALSISQEKEMTPNVVISMPSKLFTLARKFQAASNGKIYIGKVDTDPTIPENQIPVYLENEDGSTTPVAQPLIINQAGFPVYNGQMGIFKTVGAHSMAVYDASGAQQFYFGNTINYESQTLLDLQSPDGFKLIGACNSIDELKNVTPENNLQRIIVNKYYASESYFMPRQYIWYSTSLRQDDGGVVIASNKISTGRWILQEVSESFDARVFGMKPEKEYSDTMMNCATQFVKAASVVTQNGIIHFVLPNGWESAHYLINDPYKIDFGKCWIKADKGVTLHIPGTADREGWQPKVIGDITISEKAPNNANTFKTDRGGNDYDLKSAISSAMVSAGIVIGESAHQLKLTESGRVIKVNNFTGASNSLYTVSSEGATLSDDALSWSNPSAAGASSAGIEFSSNDGSEVEMLIINKTAISTGEIRVGTRGMIADGTV